MKRILFICMGNICRSPSAEGVFRHLVREAGLDGEIEVSSAGTHGYHVGESPDARTQRAAASRGFDLSDIRARKLAAQDIEDFDLLLVMDRNNLDSLLAMVPAESRNKIKLFMEYARGYDDKEVPDPYYGLGHGFDLVLDMIEDASRGLLDEVSKNLRRRR